MRSNFASMFNSVVFYCFCSKQECDLAIECYSQRAACYKRMSNYEGAIGDYTWILEYRPTHVDTLTNRGDAYESCGKYKAALCDLRQVLTLTQVHKTNTEGITSRISSKLSDDEIGGERYDEVAIELFQVCKCIVFVDC